MSADRRHCFVICAFGESPYLEDCVRSLLSQTVKSRILISTSTPNLHIQNLADQYQLALHINTGDAGIAGDWNYAYAQADTEIVTLAHQDDLYREDYTKNLLAYERLAKNPLIFFTDYEEISHGKTRESNRNLRLKRMMLSPLSRRVFWNNRFVRRRILALGNAICCPSVSFFKKNLPSEPFKAHFQSNVDWEAWEKLSRLQGEFIYCNKRLMQHRIHEESETTRTVESGRRTNEDLEMFKKFWPAPLAKVITKLYRNSEKTNRV